MVIFKKDSLPSEEELVAYRKGEKYDPEAKAKEKTEQVKFEDKYDLLWSYLQNFK